MSSPKIEQHSPAVADSRLLSKALTSSTPIVSFLPIIMFKVSRSSNFDRIWALIFARFIVVSREVEEVGEKECQQGFGG